MGRKAIAKKRKAKTGKVNKWLNQLLIKLQHENLEKLTIDDIASLAGKSKSTIYEYFETKEDILEAACLNRVNEISESIMELYKQNLITVDLYEQLVEAFAQGTKDISIHFLQSIKRYFPGPWNIVNLFTDQFIELLKEQYKTGMSEGIFSPISIELLGQLDKLFVIQVVTNRNLFSDRKYTLSKLVTEYLNLRLRGLLIR